MNLITKRWAASRFIVGIPWPSARVPSFLLVHNANLNWGLTIPGGSSLVDSCAGLLVLGLTLWIASHVPRSASAYVPVLSGGAGNVLERVMRGSASDFINATRCAVDVTPPFARQH